jgi:hypothetical protein
MLHCEARSTRSPSLRNSQEMLVADPATHQVLGSAFLTPIRRWRGQHLFDNAVVIQVSCWVPMAGGNTSPVFRTDAVTQKTHLQEYAPGTLVVVSCDHLMPYDRDKLSAELERQRVLQEAAAVVSPSGNVRSSPSPSHLLACDPLLGEGGAHRKKKARRKKKKRERLPAELTRQLPLAQGCPVKFPSAQQPLARSTSVPLDLGQDDTVSLGRYFYRNSRASQSGGGDGRHHQEQIHPSSEPRPKSATVVLSWTNEMAASGEKEVRRDKHRDGPRPRTGGTGTGLGGLNRCQEQQQQQYHTRPKTGGNGSDGPQRGTASRLSGDWSYRSSNQTRSAPPPSSASFSLTHSASLPAHNSKPPALVARPVVSSESHAPTMAFEKLNFGAHQLQSQMSLHTALRGRESRQHAGWRGKSGAAIGSSPSRYRQIPR